MNPRRFWLQLVTWVGVYIALILAPLVVAGLGTLPPARGFWIEFGVGLGFVGLAMLGLQFVLTARFRQIAEPFGTDALLQFHRQAGIVSYWFILGHVIVLLLADFDNLTFFDPRVNAPRSVALVTVLILMTLLVVLTLKRERAGLVYEWWRLTHGIFALLVVFIGMAHILMVGYYVAPLWKQAIWVVLTLAAMGLLVYVRLVKPLQALKHPYTLVDIRREAERTWTLDVKPAGHEGLRFKAGQFAWITFGGSPFSLEQHPFSFSSSAARNERLQFTVKELGDFTSEIQRLAPGQRLYLEGPYGAFTLGEAGSDGALFVAGGIGITPIMSILRTLRDQQDSRSHTLIYGARRLEELAFHDEIEQMKAALNLQVIYVLDEPSEGWVGEQGYVTRELLERVCPTSLADVEYFVCGPEPMMDLVETTFRQWGVPLRTLHAERFNIA
ncbi:ferric reductase-like transmembrane domain-containing protein [Phycisphaerales bacterium AB-hyl4]|uniref:Ferric reductase-like transmembrane domain-containing protein n=1 Tax=Natronomicrosphaera hydrolytica TaxID=3242702 RepID=A0ABV4U9I7_9BACT